ncbi:MAG: HDIG domain-containing protein [Anaerolineae bacterium]|nr:HDIG domain-containing protein [Anaerolineae bacterium]
MTAKNSTSTGRIQSFWLTARIVAVNVLFVAGVTFILLMPKLQSRALDELEVGDIATEDIRAPREISYVSQIETDLAKEAAAANIQDIFTDPNPRTSREQIVKARQLMSYIKDVRADSFASESLKQTYLQAITLVDLSTETLDRLIQIPDSQFEMVESESASLIEEAMSGTVKEGHVEEIANQLELKVSTDMPEDLIPLTVEISRKLIKANSMLNVEETETQRQNARNAVPDIRHNYMLGEVMVRAGERIDELDYEALTALGLTSQSITWMDIASAFLIALLSAVLISVYLLGFARDWLHNPGRLLLILALFLIFAFIAQVMVPNSNILPYLFPAAALSLALTTLIGAEFAALVAVVLAITVGSLANSPFEIATLMTVSGLFAAGSLRRTSRLNTFFISGLAAATASIAVILIFKLPNQTDTTYVLQLILLTILNGLLSAGIALVLLFVIGSLTGMATSLKLTDLQRPDNVLQRKLQNEALGTYQHSLAVANVAEAAAQAINADSLLARVGALYHDIGKVTNPGFFIENRTEGGRNPHDDISPLASARIIRAHVTDGLELAKRHRLPPRVTDFIAEHHGTMPILFFMHKAKEEAAQSGSEIDESQFCYDGPTPHSPETAILMLSDSCEVAARANRPASSQEIEELVTRIVQQRLDYNQLDDSQLTLTEIKLIKESIVRTLKGIYHPRIKYPGDKHPEALKPGTRASLPPSTDQDAVEEDNTPTPPPAIYSEALTPDEAPSSMPDDAD